MLFFVIIEHDSLLLVGCLKLLSCIHFKDFDGERVLVLVSSIPSLDSSCLYLISMYMIVVSEILVVFVREKMGDKGLNL